MSAKAAFFCYNLRHGPSELEVMSNDTVCINHSYIKQMPHFTSFVSAFIPNFKNTKWNTLFGRTRLLSDARKKLWIHTCVDAGALWLLSLLKLSLAASKDLQANLYSLILFC